MILALHAIMASGFVARIDAALMVERNGIAEVMQRLCLIVRPQGWTLPSGCGLTQSEAERYGLPIRPALAPLTNLTRVASEVVAHGLAELDLAVVATLAIERGPAEWIRPNLRRVCTRRLATPVLRIPKPNAAFDDTFLEPTFEQACEHFEIESSGADSVYALRGELDAIGMLEAA